MTTKLDLSFSIDQKIKTLKEDINNNFWVLVEHLNMARNVEIWKKMDYPSWSSYLSQPEIDLQVATVNRYISVYRKMKPYMEHAPNLDIGKMQAIAPHINKNNAEDLIEKATALSRSDLRRELGQKPEFEPSNVPRNNIITCPYCGGQFEEGL